MISIDNRNSRIAFYVNDNNVTFFHSFKVEHIPKEIRKLIANKHFMTSNYRIQASDSLMSEYFCIRFIDFMLKGKPLLVYTYLFSPNNYEKNDRIILKHF